MREMASNVPFTSPYYPFERVQNYTTMRGTEKIPKKILNYLLDLPDKYGYRPVDDNTRPRVRFIKYLWYDESNPLGKTLPTPQQKLSLVFDGDHPVIDTDELKAKHPKGYRIYPQKLWLPSQVNAQSILKCYMSRTTHSDELNASVGIGFEVWCNANIMNNTKTDDYERAYNIEQCIVEALHGVNIGGVGVVMAGRYSNLENGSNIAYDETGTNVGRKFFLSVNWRESESGDTLTAE